MASKLLEKDKKDVAALLKAECCGYHSNRLILNEFLDHLLGTKASLNQLEILDWCKTIIAGDRGYEFFCDQGIPTTILDQFVVFVEQFTNFDYYCLLIAKTKLIATLLDV